MTDMTNQDVIRLLDEYNMDLTICCSILKKEYRDEQYENIKKAKKHLQEMDERMGAGFFGVK